MKKKNKLNKTIVCSPQFFYDPICLNLSPCLILTYWLTLRNVNSYLCVLLNDEMKNNELLLENHPHQCQSCMQKLCTDGVSLWINNIYLILHFLISEARYIIHYIS